MLGFTLSSLDKKASEVRCSERQVLMRLAKLLGIRHSLDELSIEDYDVMADALVTAALDGEPWAIQEIARVFDE